MPWRLCQWGPRTARLLPTSLPLCHCQWQCNFKLKRRRMPSLTGSQVVRLAEAPTGPTSLAESTGPEPQWSSRLKQCDTTTGTLRASACQSVRRLRRLSLIRACNAPSQAQAATQSDSLLPCGCRLRSRTSPCPAQHTNQQQAAQPSSTNLDDRSMANPCPSPWAQVCRCGREFHIHLTAIAGPTVVEPGVLDQPVPVTPRARTGFCGCTVV